MRHCVCKQCPRDVRMLVTHWFLCYSWVRLLTAIILHATDHAPLTVRPSDVTWRHRSGSTLAQVMACCLTAPSPCLNQCWLFAYHHLRWQSLEGNFTKVSQSSIKLQNYLFNISFNSPNGQWIKPVNLGYCYRCCLEYRRCRRHLIITVWHIDQCFFKFERCDPLCIEQRLFKFRSQPICMITWIAYITTVTETRELSRCQALLSLVAREVVVMTTPVPPVTTKLAPWQLPAFSCGAVIRLLTEFRIQGNGLKTKAAWRIGWFFCPQSFLRLNRR